MKDVAKMIVANVATMIIVGVLVHTANVMAAAASQRKS